MSIDTANKFSLDDHDDHEHAFNVKGRSLSRTIAIAAVVALLAAYGHRTAQGAFPPPSPEFVVGHGTMTTQSDCPNGLSAELMMTKDGGLWRATVQTSHTACTVRTDLPLRFVGEWDPEGVRRCDLTTGANCLRREDGPGLLSIGPVVATNVAVRVNVEYAQGMSRIKGSALLWRIAAPSTLPPTPITMLGLAEVTPPGCNRGAYKVPFVAGTDGGGEWFVARPAALGVACEGIVYGGPTLLQGAYQPSDGGCIASSGAKLCLGPMPHRGLTNGIPATWCPDTKCFHGEAWLSRL